MSGVAARVCWRIGAAWNWTDESKALNEKVVAKEKEVEELRKRSKQAGDDYDALGRQQEAAASAAQSNTDPAKAAALKEAVDALDAKSVKAELDVETASIVLDLTREELRSLEEQFEMLFELDLYFATGDCPNVLTDGPPVAEAIALTQEAADCHQLARRAEQKEAAAKAAQAAATEAGAEADRAARAATATAGKDPRDVIAAREIAGCWTGSGSGRLRAGRAGLA